MKYGFCRRVCINLDLIGRRFAKQIHRDEAKRNRDEFFGVDWKKSNLYEVLKVQTLIILDSSMVEHSAVNRVVVGSSPTRGVFFFLGSMVKRLRHRPFTAVTRVRISLGSFIRANLISNLIWRHSQVVRRGSATPWSPVQIWLSPLRNHRKMVPFLF